MGIRGLTTFIRENSYKCMESYQLHDTYLVIDGNNLASHLYIWHANCYDCFGGDYDKYAKLIEYFFDLLKQCNVTPLVILDGGYENKKLATIYSRVRSSINLAGKLNSSTEGTYKVFPLHTREIFVDILLRMDVKMVRCDFEADMEMASIATILNCPILSYDSDFYVLDVLYIPFNTVSLKIEKWNKNGMQYNYISCQMYHVEKFLKSLGGLKKEVLPLLATVLGNDYIKSSVFAAFYSHIKLPRRKHIHTEQQRRILAVTAWLKTETYESAVKKILSRVKERERKYIYEEITKVMEIYTSEGSKYLNLLGVKYQVPSKRQQQFMHLKLDEVKTESECCSNDTDSSSGESTESAKLTVKDLAAEEATEYNLPDWFITNHRKCWYPSCFMDIAVRNMYFFKPQLEDYSIETSHNVCLKIIRAIHKILSYGRKRRLIYMARNAYSLRKNYVPQEESKLLSLDEILLMSNEFLQWTLLRIVELTTINLKGIPDAWKLLFITVVYWIESCTSLINQNHIYALSLGMLIIYFVDNKIGYCRNKTKFNKKYNLTYKVELDKLVDVPTQFEEAISQISAQDCVSILRKTINYFDMDEKLQRNHRIYDITIVDIFARFQSCFYYIKYLNILLNRPFEDMVISDYYNGTFLYNLCMNLLKRNDLDDYLKIFLKDSQTMLNLFQCFIASIKSNVSYEVCKNVTKKRKKRKNKKTLNDEPPDIVVESENEILDVNNRFSVLNVG